jgi:hypothetical protein
MPDPPDGTPRLRDPGLLTIPVTLQLQYPGQTSLGQLQQSLTNFTLQSQPARLTFGQALSRLQSMSTVTFLERTVPTMGDIVVDTIFRGTVGWAQSNGLRLNPDIETHVHLLNFNDLQLTLYGEVKFELQPMVPSAQLEWIGGGVQINWGGRLPAGAARRPRH